MPPPLLRPGPPERLLGFIRGTPARARRRASEQANARVDESDAMAGYRAAADGRRRRLLEEFAPVLSRSDHSAVCVEARLAAAAAEAEPEQEVEEEAAAAEEVVTGAVEAEAESGRLRLRVVSQNVQELVSDGVHTCACAVAARLKGLPEVPPAGRAVELLKEAMLSPPAARAQLEWLRSLLEGEVPHSAAVCLQELSDGLVADLRALCGAPGRGWHMHASEPAPPRGRAGASCAARTCIISSSPLRPEPDVVASFSGAGGAAARTRRFAAATLRARAEAGAGGGVVLASVHFLHAAERAAAGEAPPSNASHICEGVSQAARQLRGRLRQGGTLFLVGDFNGPVGGVADLLARDDGGDDGGDGGGDGGGGGGGGGGAGCGGGAGGVGGVGDGRGGERGGGGKVWQWHASPAGPTQLSLFGGGERAAADGAVALSLRRRAVRRMTCALLQPRGGGGGPQSREGGGGEGGVGDGARPGGKGGGGGTDGGGKGGSGGGRGGGAGGSGGEGEGGMAGEGGPPEPGLEGRDASAEAEAEAEAEAAKWAGLALVASVSSAARQQLVDGGVSEELLSLPAPLLCSQLREMAVVSPRRQLLPRGGPPHPSAVAVARAPTHRWWQLVRW